MSEQSAESVQQWCLVCERPGPCGKEHGPSRTADTAPMDYDPSRRLLTCVENWPECEPGLYDPRCCRFPKSCSCTIWDPQYVTEADLEPAHTDG